MITADTLKTLTSFTAPALSRALDVSGYKDCVFNTAEFLGITNGGQFCYKVTYRDERDGLDAIGKVFLTYNSGAGSVTADF
jgi:hypothetical protein